MLDAEEGGRNPPARRRAGQGRRHRRSRPLRLRPRAHRNGQERLRRYLEEHGLAWSDFMSLPGAERALWVARCRHANGRPPLRVREGQGAGRDVLRRFYEDPEAMAPSTEELEAVRDRRPADRFRRHVEDQGLAWAEFQELPQEERAAMVAAFREAASPAPGTVAEDARRT